MTEKRQKTPMVRWKHDKSLTKQSILEEYNFLYNYFFLEEAFANLLELVRRWTINHINIDLRHQYGISLAEAQTSLLAKRPKRRSRSGEKRLYSRASDKTNFQTDYTDGLDS